MSFLEQFHLLQRLHQLIRRKGTGNHQDLATRLGVSRSALYRHLDILRNLGAEITYCPQRKSFYYVEDFELKL